MSPDIHVAKKFVHWLTRDVILLSLRVITNGSCELIIPGEREQDQVCPQKSGTKFKVINHILDLIVVGNCKRKPVPFGLLYQAIVLLWY
jgi:hypothetical protein